MNILFFLKPKVEIARLYDDNSLRQALEVMEHHQYSAIPILSRDGKCVGTITEGDLLWAIKKMHNLNTKEAENIPIMSIKRRNDYKAVHAEAKMEDLIGRAMEQNFVPVEDDQGNFIGIITRKDIIGYCYEKLNDCDK